MCRKTSPQLTLASLHISVDPGFQVVACEVHDLHKNGQQGKEAIEHKHWLPILQGEYCVCSAENFDILKIENMIYRYWMLDDNSK